MRVATRTSMSSESAKQSNSVKKRKMWAITSFKVIQGQRAVSAESPYATFY